MPEWYIVLVYWYIVSKFEVGFALQAMVVCFLLPARQSKQRSPMEELLLLLSSGSHLRPHLAPFQPSPRKTYLLPLLRLSR